MKISHVTEWAAFACGLVIAVIVWSGLHPDYGTAAANAEVHQTELQAGRLDKQAGDDGGEEQGRGVGGAKNGNAGENAENGTGSEINGNANGGSVNDQAIESSPNVQTSGGEKSTAADTTAQTPLPADAEPQLTVRVYLTDERRIESVPLETYVRGVVAAEMPADFEPAALEAQALTARTYIVRRLLLGDDSGVPVPGADVTDTQTHQVYRSLEEMDRLRADDEQAWRKADEAAARTKGTVIAYDGQPIQALYFSTSNGYTENSEDVFPARLPYLRSVESPWDREGAPRSQETIEMPLKQFYAKLGIRALPALSLLTGTPKMKITEWTKGKRVKAATVGGKSFTGQELRELLDLRSAAFNWSVKDGEIRITTYGSGHGVGMSQWGAQGMAESGKTAEQIIRHYYPGTELMEVSKLADNL